MIFDVDGRAAVGVFVLPFGVLGSAPIGQQFGWLHTLSEGKIPRAPADKHNVGRAFHDHTGHRYGVEDILQRGYAATVAVRPHTAGIEGDDSVPVRETATADGVDLRVGFGQPGAGLGGIEG